MPNKLPTTLPAVNGNKDYAILVSKSNIFAYENGKKISDNPIGTKLTIALPNAQLSQLGVKFETDPIPKISEDLINKANSTCQFLFVQIPDCSVTLYNSNNGFIMTATAKTAQIVNLNKE